MLISYFTTGGAKTLSIYGTSLRNETSTCRSIVCWSRSSSRGGSKILEQVILPPSTKRDARDGYGLC